LLPPRNETRTRRAAFSVSASVSPQITGYLLAGIAAGPHGAGLLSAGLLARMAPVEAACLAAIALAAGAELHLSELQRTRRQVH